jgi:hypothetical protein
MTFIRRPIKCAAIGIRDGVLHHNLSNLRMMQRDGWVQWRDSAHVFNMRAASRRAICAGAAASAPDLIMGCMTPPA